ncbi:DUF1707 SHOCT-like domain-containing protein [Nocardiopsis coralliicola]
MRASDADRDAAAERLAAALAEGRLTLAEYDERLHAAMAAVHRADLAALTADLPEPPAAPADPVRTGAADGDRHPAGAAIGPAPSRWREWGEEWRWWLGGAVIMAGIWGVTSIMSGTLVTFWPLVPLGIWAAILLAAAIWPDEDPGAHS